MLNRIMNHACKIYIEVYSYMQNGQIKLHCTSTLYHFSMHIVQLWRLCLSPGLPAQGRSIWPQGLDGWELLVMKTVVNENSATMLAVSSLWEDTGP